MCGISGTLGDSDLSAHRLDDLSQRHRGPDDAGQYTDPAQRAQLSFRRLSILDLTRAGHQPMCNENGTVWLVFNGEIYNHLALRAELERAGHVFQSRTDSEVLVHLWEEHGRAMVDRLNGMFAFCIWDQRTGEAFLARDHAGIKPLYIARTSTGLAFASEAKVLLRVPGVDRSIDRVALRQYLTFLWVPGQRTMWRGISKLPPGGWLSWTPERVESGLWWDWDQSTKEDRSSDDWVRTVRGTVLDSVSRQLMSDVPLGAMLSGGLDSTAIVGAMRELHPEQSIRAYTARVRGPSTDGFSADYPYAVDAAAHLRADLVTEDVSPSLTSLLPMLVWHMDEPIADPAIAASYVLCRRAREDGTVVLLSGQGADELYHGYRSHTAMRMAGSLPGVPAPLVRMASAMAEALASGSGMSARASPRRVVKLLRFLGARNDDRILQLADWGSADIRSSLLEPALGDASATDVYGEYLSLFGESRAHTDEERWSYVLFKTFLPALNLAYGDRTSMAVSVELRVPYLDRELIEQAGRIPGCMKYRDGRQKWVLGEAARDWLPPSILRRSKTGFGAPLRDWLSKDLRREMAATLLGEQARARALFRPEGVAALFRELDEGRRDVAYIVWALYTFELWARTFVDADGASPVLLSA